MAKLVIGKNKIKAAPAILKDSSPEYYIEKTLDNNGTLVNSKNIPNLKGFTDIGPFVFKSQYRGVWLPVNTVIDLSDVQSLTSMESCYEMFMQTYNIIKVDLSSLTTVSSIGGYAMNRMFSGSQQLKSVDLSSLTTVSGLYQLSGAFSGCALVTFELPSLTTISGVRALESMLSSCKSLTKASFPALKTVSGDYAMRQLFDGCNELTTIEFPALETVDGTMVFENFITNTTSKLTTAEFPALTTLSGSRVLGNMFYASSALTTVRFNKLKNIDRPLTEMSYRVFNSCPKLENVEFGGLTSATFNSRLDLLTNALFSSTTGSQAPNGCTLHFPSNFDPENPNKTFDITTLTGYPTFGGSASYIHLAYDLPATE